MARCEDYPCCGHEAGCCPDFDEDGKQVNMICVCGKKLPVNNRYSICEACMNTPGGDGIDGPDYYEEYYDYPDYYYDREVESLDTDDPPPMDRCTDRSPPPDESEPYEDPDEPEHELGVID